MIGKRKIGLKDMFTPQQQHILTLLAKGYSNEEICSQLSINQSTLYNHMKTLRLKTGLRSRVLLGFYAFSHGFVSQDDIREAMRRERKA
jgi:DNA-binding NarL/FixJ family response regulator